MFSPDDASPEHEVSKLMWLKETLPESWEAAAKVQISWCTSLTSVCKLAYMRQKNSWDTSFFEDISLSDLLSRKLVPNDIRVMGACAGPLTPGAVLLLILIFDIGVVMRERKFFSPSEETSAFIII